MGLLCSSVTYYLITMRSLGAGSCIDPVEDLLSLIVTLRALPKLFRFHLLEIDLNPQLSLRFEHSVEVIFCISHRKLGGTSQEAQTSKKGMNQ